MPILTIGLAILLVILVVIHYQSTKNSRKQLLAAQQKEEASLTQLRQDHKEQLQQLEESTQQEMEHFRSVLSHSLRMPLSVVQGYAELLVGDMVPDEGVQQEYLRKIIQRTTDMSTMLTNHLAEARSDETVVLATAHLDLLALIEQVAADLQMPALQRGISIHIICTETQAMATVDAYQITKVLFNLIENSIKYMGREGRVTITLLPVGGSIQIKVKDDGLGLDPDETAHIFKQNFQGSNRTSGHGHGLYLCKQAIEAHGGTITAYSQRGRGMGTTIILPTHLEPTSA